MLDDGDALVTGYSVPPDRVPVSFGRRCQAGMAYLKMCRVYRRRGFPGAHQYLMDLQRRHRQPAVTSDDQAARMARWAVAPLRLLGRCICEDTHCLPRSVSLAAGLIALGLPAQVVVGKARDFANPIFDFHAWVEVWGEPVDEAPTPEIAFAVLVRCPDWPIPVALTRQPRSQ